MALIAIISVFYIFPVFIPGNYLKGTRAFPGFFNLGWHGKNKAGEIHRKPQKCNQTLKSRVEILHNTRVQKLYGIAVLQSGERNIYTLE